MDVQYHRRALLTKVHVSVNLLAVVWSPSCATRHCGRRAYAPTNNTASHDNHGKNNFMVFFSFLYGYGVPLGGPLVRRSSAIMTNRSTDYSHTARFHRS